MNLISGEQSMALTAAFQAGLGIRAAALRVGVAKNTARRYYHSGTPLLCPCGKPLIHRGWCAHRVALSPKRQKFISRFAGRKVHRGVRLTTIRRWDHVASEVERAIRSRVMLGAVDHEAIESCRRFYPTHFEIGYEYDAANQRGQIVAVVPAVQENYSGHLIAALEKLHPSVRRLCLEIIDGSSLEEAAETCGLDCHSLDLVMPRLKQFLAPYLF